MHVAGQHNQPHMSAISVFKVLAPMLQRRNTTLRKHKSGKIGSRCLKYIQVFIAAYMHSGWVKIISCFGSQFMSKNKPLRKSLK